MKPTELVLTATLALALTSCAQGELPNFGTETSVEQQPQEEIDNAEAIFGITIDENHTWIPTAERTLQIANFPAGFETQEVAIFTANPFADTTAAYLTWQEGALSTITYEAPGDAETLYAACINADGVMRVKAFDVADGVVDMQETSETRAEATRAEAVIPNKSELTWKPSAHKRLGLTEWDDNYALIDRGSETVQLQQVDEIYKTALTWVPEGKQNIAKLQQYAKVYNYDNAIVSTEGGEVTVLPVYKNTGNPVYIGYFYVTPGQTIDFTTCDKYIFKDFIDRNTNTVTGEVTVNSYKLVYYNEEGVGSYQFPKGTKIFMFLCYRERYDHSCACKDFCNWYSMGTLNLQMHEHKFDAHGVNPSARGGNDGWMDYPHVCYFNRNGINYVTCEDGSDFDMNDLVLTMQGDIEDFPDVASPEPNALVYTYAFEDSKIGDYDMNDCVIQVWAVKPYPTLRVRLVAIGAHDELKLYFNDPSKAKPIALFNGREVHEVMGLSDTHQFVNTQEVDITKLPTFDFKVGETATETRHKLSNMSFVRADFYLVNETKGYEIHLPSAQNRVGATPLAICIPGTWAWPKENTSVTKAYRKMIEYAEDQAVNIDWYKSPSKNKVISLE
jgi:hypothetical protein